MLTVTDPSIRKVLTEHQAEREAWLAETIVQLEADERVDAAWLFGSLGRGDADELSDVDLFVTTLRMGLSPTATISWPRSPSHS